MSQAPEAEGGSGPFWRPTTRLNALVDAAVGAFPPRGLDAADLAPLHARARGSLLALGAEPEAVQAVASQTDWIIADGRSPSDAWGGEVLRNGDEPPHVVLYRDSALTRLPLGWIRRMASQLTVDHMYGHLYEYHRGAEDWGEAVACRWQVRLLRQRGGVRNRVLAWVVAVTHRFHKQIPLSNY